MLQAAPGAGPAGVRLTVRDTGPGIGAAELARIFQPFQQAGARGAADRRRGPGADDRARDRHRDGRRHHRAERARRRARPSTSMRCCPPCRRPQPRAAAAARAPPARALPRLVLVAEDDEVNAMIVGALLDSLGVRTSAWPTASRRCSRALRETDRPELVLMDCRMPVMDGLTATAEIRRQERLLGLPRLPILALTAADGDADRAACLAAGMDDVHRQALHARPVAAGDARRCAAAGAQPAVAAPPPPRLKRGAAAIAAVPAALSASSCRSGCQVSTMKPYSACRAADQWRSARHHVEAQHVVRQAAGMGQRHLARAVRVGQQVGEAQPLVDAHQRGAACADHQRADLRGHRVHPAGLHQHRPHQRVGARRGWPAA